MRYMKITAIGLMLLVHVAQAAPVLNPAGISRIMNEGDDDPVRSKTFSKTFAADNSDKIVLGNQYGSIVIKIWDRKEVKADIDIKAFSNDEAGAQKLLDGVTIEAGKSGDQIIFKTKLEEKGNWGRGSRLGRKWRREVKIDYVVYMPASNALTMSQNYGNIVMGDLTGPLYAKVQYGNFAAQNLASSNNYISVQYGNTNIQSVNKAVVKQQYGSGLTIGTAGTLDLNVQYAAVNVSTIKGDAVIRQQYGSGLTIGTVHDLDLNAQYCNVSVSSIKGDARIDQQYNSLTIGSVGKLELKTQYTSTAVETLRGDGRFDMQYNKLSINEVTNGCKALSIDGDYLNISVVFNTDYHADLEVQTSYAAFKYGDRVSAIQVGNKEDSNSKHYMGKIGKGAGAAVRIKSDYGSVAVK